MPAARDTAPATTLSFSWRSDPEGARYPRLRDALTRCNNAGGFRLTRRQPGENRSKIK